MLGTGLLQDPMFGSGTPSGIALFLPDYGAMRVVVDGGFSATFTAWEELALALAWLAVLVESWSWSCVVSCIRGRNDG